MTLRDNRCADIVALILVLSSILNQYLEETVHVNNRLNLVGLSTSSAFSLQHVLLKLTILDSWMHTH
mgnify:CR=1 FL=1